MGRESIDYESVIRLIESHGSYEGVVTMDIGPPYPFPQTLKQIVARMYKAADSLLVILEDLTDVRDGNSRNVGLSPRMQVPIVRNGIVPCGNGSFEGPAEWIVDHLRIPQQEGYGPDTSDIVHREIILNAIRDNDAPLIFLTFHVDELWRMTSYVSLNPICEDVNFWKSDSNLG